MSTVLFKIRMSAVGTMGVLALCLGPVALAQNPAPPTTQLSDGQIEKIVGTSNSVEIDLSKLAESRSQNPEVKKFAKMMIADHQKWNKEGDSLAKKIRTPPEESPASQTLSTDGKSTLDRLAGLKGAEFDRAYVNEEVSFHRNVVDTIDEKLLPNAKNKDLQDMLKTTKPKVEAHLEHARKVQETVNK